MNKKNSTYQKTALLITATLALLTVSCLLWIWLAAPNMLPSEQLVADIYQNGELIQSIPLDTVEETYTFTVIGENNCQNAIEVRPGSIGITSADCPDKLCVNQGFISSSLLPITCLPNHLVIQIRTENIDRSQDSSVDIVTY